MKQLEQEHKVLNGEAKRQPVFKFFKSIFNEWLFLATSDFNLFYNICFTAKKLI